MSNSGRKKSDNKLPYFIWRITVSKELDCWWIELWLINCKDDRINLGNIPAPSRDAAEMILKQIREAELK